MRRQKPARYRLISHPNVLDDLTALSAYGADAVTAARIALNDLAHGRVTGKTLGERHVSGDLTGLASLKFDVPGSPTRRFRLVYADIDTTTRGVLAIGVRRSTRSTAWPSSESKLVKAMARSRTTVRLHNRWLFGMACGATGSAQQ